MTKVSKEKNVTAIVVTYNRKELLKECIESLISINYSNLHVLIIDNASTDGTKDYIRSLVDNKKVFYKNTGSNLGGAGGFNFGMKEAIKLKDDYLWLMDDDCIVHRDTLKELLNASKELNDNFGFLASKVLWKDNSICKMNIQKRSITKKNEDWNSKYVNVIMSTFVSFFVKTDVVKEIGLPISDFFIWADDLEYSRRISKKYNCYLINDSVVTHKSKNNIGSNIAIDAKENLGRYRYSYRNETYLYRKEGLFGRLYYFLKRNYHKFKIFKSNVDDKNERYKIINESFKEGKNFKPSIEYVNSDEPKRVLIAFGEPISFGGQETFIMNMYRSIDKSKVQFDFLTPYYCDNLALKAEMERMGANVFAMGGHFDEEGNKKDLVKNINSFFASHKYYIVHIHSGSTFALMYISKMAKKSGAKDVIVHSHCGGFKDLRYQIVKFLSTIPLLKYPNHYYACSKIAADWKFPKSIIRKQKYEIIKNGIDTKKFYYDKKIRKAARQKLGIDNKIVIGHIGRFAIQKNHKFLIQIFSEIHKKDKSTVLLLIGDGDKVKEIKDLVRELQIEDCVKFLGLRTDINDLLNAMDAFVLPSFFEGLPMVGVEAEATGLPVFASDCVTRELPIQNLTKYYSLNESSEMWAKNILATLKSFERKNTTNEIVKAGFDIKNEAKRLENLYLDM